MAITVQNVVNQVSTDIRSVLGTAAPDATIIINWVDRIHKDCLHTSVYSYLNFTTTSVTTVVGTASYTLTPTNIRRIAGVYSRTRDRILFPIERATNPVAQQEKGELQPGQTPPQFTMPALQPLQLQYKQPMFFRHLGASTLVFYPTPQQIETMDVSYELQVADLVNLTDTLVIPSDGIDMLVAGTNYLANLFLKRAEEAQFWMMIYQQLKLGQGLV